MKRTFKRNRLPRNKIWEEVQQEKILLQKITTEQRLKKIYTYEVAISHTEQQPSLAIASHSCIPAAG